MTAEASLEQAVADMQQKLGENLHSVCIYGSAVRGNVVPGVSDTNLLIVLQKSDAAAHAALAEVIGANPRIDPFILGLAGFDRSVRAFAAKFSSIRRHYRVLHGADPLAGIAVAPELERFLCEQALRNLRLRIARAFVTRQQHKSYSQFLARSVTPLFLRLSEVLRLSDLTLPDDFSARAEPLAKHFGVEFKTLDDLLDFKREPREFSNPEAAVWHARVFPVLNTAVVWIETHWPETTCGG